MGLRKWPLGFYRSASFYTMRTDALNLCLTAQEQRFTEALISNMTESAGLRDFVFPDESPYGCVVGQRCS